MNSKEEKIQLIIKTAKENNLSYYDIGQEMEDVSLSSLEKIFKGRQTNPREKTLNKILEFLEQKIVGTQNQYDVSDRIKAKIEEEKETYIPMDLDNTLLTQLLQESKSTAALLLKMAGKLVVMEKELQELKRDTQTIKSVVTDQSKSGS